MELVERYIAAVQRELPEAKRDEIGRELKANILDQLDALTDGETPDNEQVAQVLIQMGRPQQVARQFVPAKPLIAAEDMQSYLYTLYIVLGVLFVIQVLGSTVAWLDNDSGLLLYFKSVLSGFVGDACLAFTAITLGFAFSGKKAVTVDKSSWQPSALPPVDAPWQHISLQDIFTNLATYAFLLVVVWYPATLSPAELAEKSVLLSDNARWLLSWCTPLMLAGIALCVWQLRERYWNPAMQWANVAVNLLSIAILIYLAANGPLLQINTERWVEVIGWERLHRAMTYGLLITACFPGYEVVRDLRRLWQQRS